MIDASPPVVEMLWEPVDPHDTLHSRFGFGSTDAVVAWVGSALLARCRHRFPRHAGRSGWSSMARTHI